MKREREPKLSARMESAIEELKGLIRQHYPDATFKITRSPENKNTILLKPVVDVEDRDEIMDVVIDRMMELQIEEKLPLFVIAVRPRERALEIMRQQEEARKKRAQPPSTQT